MTSIKTHCMTLRLPHDLDAEIREVAYDSRTSKAKWIRDAIQKNLRQKPVTNTGYKKKREQQQ